MTMPIPHPYSMDAAPPGTDVPPPGVMPVRRVAAVFTAGLVTGLTLIEAAVAILVAS